LKLSQISLSYAKEYKKNTELYTKIGNLEEKSGTVHKEMGELIKRTELLEKELAEYKK
jgi:hypothetical protein